jgi:hypothetical protein
MTQDERLEMMLDSFAKFCDMTEVATSEQWPYLCGCFQGMCVSLSAEIGILKNEIKKLKQED